MESSVQKVEQWKEQAPQGPSRWPGAAVRITHGTKKGEIDFRRGVVVQVSNNSIIVEMDHPNFPMVRLMGDAYIHFCPACKASIPGNVTYNRQAEFRSFCPYCGPEVPLKQIEVGDKLRLHYRFNDGTMPGPKGQYANWYGEVWEW